MLSKKQGVHKLLIYYISRKGWLKSSSRPHGHRAFLSRCCSGSAVKGRTQIEPFRRWNPLSCVVSYLTWLTLVFLSQIGPLDAFGDRRRLTTRGFTWHDLERVTPLARERRIHNPLSLIRQTGIEPNYESLLSLSSTVASFLAILE